MHIMQTKMTAIAAMALLAFAAFAGVGLLAEDSDAAEGDVTVSYKVGEMTYTDSAPAQAGAVYSLKSLADLGLSVGDGKTFGGWKVAGDESGAKYAAGSGYAIPAGVQAVQFVAEITENTYLVKFTYADGTLIKEFPGSAYDAEITLPAKAPTASTGKVIEFIEASGEVFVGWSVLKADGTVGDLVLDADATKVKATADVTYVATYQKDIVLTYVVDGIITYSSTSYKHVVPNDPAKDGFSFVGWSDGTKTVEAKDLDAYLAKATEDVTFTAVFEPAIYTVSFEVDGKVVATQTVKHGELAIEPAFVPALEGQDFVKWDFDFTEAVTSDVTVKAVFEPTPEPEPTGLKDPVTLTVLIVAALVLGFLLVVLFLKKDDLKAGMAKRLSDDKRKGGDGQA